MTKEKSKRGRPTTYTVKLGTEICDTISSTSKGTKKLCAENKHWPCQDTLFTWLKNNTEFSEQYARAKKCQAELLVDEILEIADDASLDTVVNQNGKIIQNQQAINRARLKIDTRKWLACKLVPRVYENNKYLAENQHQNNDEEMLKELLELRSNLDKKHRRDF